LLKGLFFTYFLHNKYSLRFITLRLNHCSHMDYFNQCLYYLSGP